MSQIQCHIESISWCEAERLPAEDGRIVLTLFRDKVDDILS